MEKSLIKKDNRVPAWFMMAYMPLVFTIVSYLLWLTWSYEGALPLIWSGQSNFEVAARCCGLAIFPLIASILVIIGYRSLTPAGNTLVQADSPMFKTHLNILQNNLEATFLFCINLLACSSYKDFPAERLVALTWFFVIGRITFWVGYALGTLLDMPFLRAPGFATSLQVNVVMFAYNLSGFWS